jgi:hypothetical protein
VWLYSLINIENKLKDTHILKMSLHHAVQGYKDRLGIIPCVLDFDTKRVVRCQEEQRRNKKYASQDNLYAYGFLGTIEISTEMDIPLLCVSSLCPVSPTLTIYYY